MAVLLTVVLAMGLYAWLRREPSPDYSVRMLSSPRGWGYEISRDGQPVIYQPYRPGVAGQQGFSSEAQAQRVGERVVNKLRHGQFPPTLEPGELD